MAGLTIQTGRGMTGRRLDRTRLSEHEVLGQGATVNATPASCNIGVLGVVHIVGNPIAHSWRGQISLTKMKPPAWQLKTSPRLYLNTLQHSASGKYYPSMHDPPQTILQICTILDPSAPCATRAATGLFLNDKPFKAPQKPLEPFMILCGDYYHTATLTPHSSLSFSGEGFAHVLKWAVGIFQAVFCGL
jgi:hypothetical protein